jgi:hypothetical protein
MGGDEMMREEARLNETGETSTSFEVSYREGQPYSNLPSLTVALAKSTSSLLTVRSARHPVYEGTGFPLVNGNTTSIGTPPTYIGEFTLKFL